MIVYSIVAKITGEKRGAPERVWVRVAEYNFRPLQVLCQWKEEIQAPIVLRQTKKYICYCTVLACI